MDGEVVEECMPAYSFPDIFIRHQVFSAISLQDVRCEVTRLVAGGDERRLADETATHTHDDEQC